MRPRPVYIQIENTLIVVVLVLVGVLIAVWALGVALS